MFFKRTPPLTLINSTDPKKRILAVKRTTFRKNHPDALEVFTRAIHDSDRNVRFYAALWLQDHRELLSSCDKEQLFEDGMYFFERKKHFDWPFQLLRLLGDPRSIPAVIARLNSESTLGRDEREMIIFLGEHGDHRHGGFILSLLDKNRVFEYFKDSVEVIHSALVRTYDDKVIDALIERVNLQRSSSADFVAQSAETITGAHTLFRDPITGRMWSAITLGKIGGEKALKLLMAGIDRKTDCHLIIKRACAAGLCYARDPRAIEQLILTINTTDDTILSQICCLALVRIGEPSVPYVINECLARMSDINPHLILVLLHVDSETSRDFILKLKASVDEKLRDEIVRCEAENKEIRRPEDLAADIT